MRSLAGAWGLARERIRVVEESKRVVPDAVADLIFERILDGTFREGDRLPPERELADQLHVNRSSVREGLKKLEQLRLVTIQQGSGTRVQSSDHASFELVWAMLFPGGRPNLPWIRDLLELRDALVPGILRIAVERASARELEECAVGLSAAPNPAPGDAEFAEALFGLQESFGRATRNRVVRILSNTLSRFLAQRGFTELTRIATLDRRGLRPLIQRLAVALEARDADTAERSARDLMRRLSRRTLETLESLSNEE